MRTCEGRKKGVGKVGIGYDIHGLKVIYHLLIPAVTLTKVQLLLNVCIQIKNLILNPKNSTKEKNI